MKALDSRIRADIQKQRERAWKGDLGPTLHIVKDIFCKVDGEMIDWNSHTAWYLSRATEIALLLEENIQQGENLERLPDDEKTGIKLIAEEVKQLYDEVLKNKGENSSLNNKLICISEILRQNKKLWNHSPIKKGDGKIFQTYYGLYQAIHAINTRWDELEARGFSLKVILDFAEAFEVSRKQGTEKTEEEKLQMFMGILDGTMKFICDCKAGGCQIVPNN